MCQSRSTKHTSYCIVKKTKRNHQAEVISFSSLKTLIMLASSGSRISQHLTNCHYNQKTHFGLGFCNTKIHKISYLSFSLFMLKPPSFVTIFGGDNYRLNNYNHCKHGFVSFSSLQSKSSSGETPVLSDCVRFVILFFKVLIFRVLIGFQERK